MNKKTKKITVAAMMTALAVVFLYLAAILPTGRYGLVAAASLFGVAAVIETGISGGVFVYLGASLLGLLLVPDKLDLMLFVLFFGYYPVLKSLAERLENIVLSWIIKLAVMNGALTVILLFFSSLIFDYAAVFSSTALVYLFLNVVFVIFDIGVSKVIAYYMYRIKNVK